MGKPKEHLLVDLSPETKKFDAFGEAVVVWVDDDVIDVEAVEAQPTDGLNFFGRTP